MTLIVPKLKDEVLLDDIKRMNFDTEFFHLWWLGQSGFLLQWRGKHLLMDPYLSDSLTRKYVNTDKPHIRMTELVIDPARLNFIDIVTSSHNHTDHLDAETLIPLMNANPDMKLLIPEANRTFVAEKLKIDPGFPIGLDEGESIEINGLKFTGVPAAHETIDRDDAGRCKFLGYVIQFDSWSLYHSGDTLWYDGMEQRLEPFSIDVAILPINGKAPERRVPGNLNAKEAVTLAKLIGAKLVIACHYHMFTFNTADPQDFVYAAQAQGQRYKVLKCGERWSSHDLKI